MQLPYLKTCVAMAAVMLVAGCASSGPQATSQNSSSATTASRAGASTTAAPPSVSTSTTAAATGMQGMNHGSGSMAGMDHSSMSNMKGMDHSSMANMKGMDHSQHMQGGGTSHGGTQSSAGDHSKGHGSGGHGSSAAGRPGSAAQATRTVNVTALDTMRFDPSTLAVKAGETVRFVVVNKGKLPHEFVIGTTEEQKEHEQMMQKMPGMKHEDPNAITLAPGETKSLIWQFGQSANVEIGCHIPGHYPAGMLSKVTVSGSNR